MPNVCIGEARQAIMAKCQPRHEANALRRFLSFSEPTGDVTRADADVTRAVLQKYEVRIKRDLDRLDATLQSLAGLPYLKIFGLDDEMLNRATTLALAGLAAKPFDHAILAAVLVSSSRLWAAGERGISFCEADADLQPWDKIGKKKPLLSAAYDESHVWVYGDYTLARPARSQDFG